MRPFDGPIALWAADAHDALWQGQLMLVMLGGWVVGSQSKQNLAQLMIMMLVLGGTSPNICKDKHS